MVERVSLTFLIVLVLLLFLITLALRCSTRSFLKLNLVRIEYILVRKKVLPIIASCDLKCAGNDYIVFSLTVICIWQRRQNPLFRGGEVML